MSIAPSNPRIVAIIQARMGSTRFPGKTLADIAGKPLLAHILERVKASRTINEIVIATTTNSEDQAILHLAAEHGVQAYAGSVDDVLDRFYQVARQVCADIIVRIGADDPFKDPEVLDEIVKYFLVNPELDYVSNTIEPTFPEGLDVEVFSFRALERAWKEARLPSEREHVTPYIWKFPTRFNIANIRHEVDLSHLRWTLDYEEDLNFAREVYARLTHKGIFLMEDVLALLAAEPALAKINQGIEQYAGYKASLQKDSDEEINRKG